MHNVPYNAFEKYLKLRRHFSDVHHITVTDLPEPVATEVPVARPEAEAPTTTAKTPSAIPSYDGSSGVRIMIHIRMSNGMQVSKKNMDYRELHELVEKLEALC